MAFPLIQLQRMAILREVTGRRRNRRFRYEPYVELFTGSTPSEPG